jgi:hypothetical protein
MEDYQSWLANSSVCQEHVAITATRWPALYVYRDELARGFVLKHDSTPGGYRTSARFFIEVKRPTFVEAFAKFDVDSGSKRGWLSRLFRRDDPEAGDQAFDDQVLVKPDPGAHEATMSLLQHSGVRRAVQELIHQGAEVDLTGNSVWVHDIDKGALTPSWQPWKRFCPTPWPSRCISSASRVEGDRATGPAAQSDCSNGLSSQMLGRGLFSCSSASITTGLAFFNRGLGFFLARRLARALASGRPPSGELVVRFGVEMIGEVSGAGSPTVD